MERDKVLGLIQNKQWLELLKVLKDNKVFRKLSQDSIFMSLFNQHFVDEFINHDIEAGEENITELTAIHNFHKSTDYDFKLSSTNYEKLIVLLVKKTGDFYYAKELPEHDLCQKIISEHESRQSKEIIETRESYQLNSAFSIQNKVAVSSESHVISIFKSPQEMEFYQAALEVFHDCLVIPNVALSTVINSGVLSKLEGEHKYFFLSSTVDLVIIDKETFKATHFFELDSKTYHSTQEQIEKDEIKNRLITEAGFTLCRITKNEHVDRTEEYKILLNKMK